MIEIPRPETPPPSTHRRQTPVSPETPTHAPIHKDQDNEEPTLLEDNEHISQPSTPVLYNLIRNETPPKYVVTTPEPETDEIKESPEEGSSRSHFEVLLMKGIEEFPGEMLRGHPSACLFVAR
jgi:hypothetical protein